ncbi:hypothetical protein PAXRUDRAFT_21854 [Paxillus rubicundulus Ve08.2h10]|uniref:Uncharacterized protein n=1 Tax=Paxillus rubicundulus Ve08.2h10 TaxID=930991 RepID=A0A0D0D6M5_9AGAM|nr:hypothetical protein PAXRUDRAFT_21854 [Paxillus rubicundulus Ve08.2h10]
MGFPFEQEHSTTASDRDLGPAEPSHSPSPSLLPNTIAIPSAVNLDMRWHIGPTIIRSTTPIPPSASPWTGPQMSSVDNAPISAPLTDDPPILAPASPAMSIPPVEVLVQTESASDNGGSGSSD